MSGRTRASHSLRRLVESYLLCCDTEGKSHDTLRWYRQKLDAFVSYVEQETPSPNLGHVNTDSVREFLSRLQSLGRTAFTTRGYVQVLKGFGTWLVEEGYVNRNPLGRLQLPKVPKYVVKPLSGDEVSALIRAMKPRSAAGTRDLALLLLLFDTGARLGEVAQLTMADADDAVRDGLFKVLGKGSRERYLPVGKAARDALRRYTQVYRPDARADALFLGRNGRPLAREGLRQIIRRVASRAGVEGVHPHRLRHTFAVNYLINGGDAMTLQRILGHSTLEMVRNYVSFDHRAIQERHAIASPSDRFWDERGLRRTA